MSAMDECDVCGKRFPEEEIATVCDDCCHGVYFLKELTQLRKKVEAAEKLAEETPRAFKLMERGQNFLVVADDEPYFMEVYFQIRKQEIIEGHWTVEDERAYEASRLLRCARNDTEKEEGER